MQVLRFKASKMRVAQPGASSTAKITGGRGIRTLLQGVFGRHGQSRIVRAVEPKGLAQRPLVRSALRTIESQDERKRVSAGGAETSGQTLLGVWEWEHDTVARKSVGRRPISTMPGVMLVISARLRSSAQGEREREMSRVVSLAGNVFFQVTFDGVRLAGSPSRGATIATL
ncbi:hypothetical protein LZ31DRAFT_372308 [Colletotrichum somersetense]|nr:hypothetical protein LZ31DRAFT_372308 [Colletotrichum somersetense]